MRDLHVISVSYYFPPLVGIASERASARAENLRMLGWDVTVVTVRKGHYHIVEQPHEFAFTVIRTASLELSRVIRRAYATASARPSEARTVGGAVKPVETSDSGARLRRWVREWIYIPDAQVGWVPFATFAAARAASCPGSVIFSTSVPYSAHLAACLAARWRGARWIAELRDPWSTAAAELLPTSKLRRKLDQALERFLLARADHVILTSATTRRNLLRAHPALDPDRVSVVMNGFVPLPEGPRPAPDEPCCFVFTGTVSDGERPDALLAAFAQIEAKSPGRFRFRVFGPPRPWILPSTPTPTWLELAGVVTPSAARQAIVASNATVLLQHNPARAQVLSGKAFEYIGARRPIIAVIPPESEMAEILDEYSDARIVASYDIDTLAEELERLITEHTSGLLDEPTVPEELISPLERTEQAKILDRILLDLEGA